MTMKTQDELRSLGYKVVDLCAADYLEFTGFIAPSKTGVIYTNQTAGVGCAHPWVEGAYIPIRLPDVPLEDDPLWDMWWDPNSYAESWDTYPIDEFNQWVRAYNKQGIFTALAGCEFREIAAKATQSGLSWSGPCAHEAWVPLRVLRPTAGGPTRFKDSAGRWGIITYMNSD